MNRGGPRHWRWGGGALRLGVALLILAGAVGPLRGARPVLQLEPWGQGDDAALERFLLEAEIVEVQEVGTGITRPLRLTLELDGRRAYAVWKGVQQEYARPPTDSPRRDDMYFSDRWQHEIAAYRVDRLIGLERVPVAVVRELRGQPGSLQQWIDGAFSERDRVEEHKTLSRPVDYARSAEQMHVFDALIYNVDRTQENILITEPESRLWLIDHSRAFRLRRQLPRMKGVDSELPAPLLQGLRELSDEGLREALDGLLTVGQIRAILARRDRLVRRFGAAPASSR